MMMMTMVMMMSVKPPLPCVLLHFKLAYDFILALRTVYRLTTKTNMGIT